MLRLKEFLIMIEQRFCKHDFKCVGRLSENILTMKCTKCGETEERDKRNCERLPKPYEVYPNHYKRFYHK